MNIKILFAMFACCFFADAAQCQTPTAANGFPNRPIKMVVPFPAGGPTDVMARLVAQKMSDDWGQPVVIENKPGANTVIGAQMVQNAAPDGYTLLMAIDSTLVMNQYLYKKLPYDPIADFEPISLVAKSMLFVITQADSEFKSMTDLVAAARKNPGKLNYGAGTITTKLAGVLVNKELGINIQQISYNGTSDVTNGLLTRSVDFSYDGISAALPLMQAGKVRLLAKFDSRPFSGAPETPSIQQALDLKNFNELTVWIGLVAPKGTPRDIVEKISAEVTKILAIPDVKERADAIGLAAATLPPADFKKFIQQEATRWEPVVKDSGLHYD